ncbi:MAG: peptidyl-prolyl cis-trans isomerase B (cyclophilin B) [Myxococcota bacterium]|jgi:peptidyl-prolyl cis-trans isomerase B (cyclophilin B)
MIEARKSANSSTAAHRLARLVLCFSVIAASLALVACEPKGRLAHQRQEPITEDFKAEAETFAWPDEPSHVVALEIEGYGTVRLGLFAQVAPKSVAHIVDCVTRGVFDDTLFHRVIEDFMVQGGDPSTRKRGPDSTRGDWGDLSVEDEYLPVHHDRGVVALANRGRPGTAQSQFFIVHQDSHHLDGKYSPFGKVLAGLDVVDEIASVETDKFGRWGEKDTPIENVILLRAVLESGALGARDTPSPDENPPGAERSDEEETAEIASRG